VGSPPRPRLRSMPSVAAPTSISARRGHGSRYTATDFAMFGFRRIGGHHREFSELEMTAMKKLVSSAVIVGALGAAALGIDSGVAKYSRCSSMTLQHSALRGKRVSQFCQRLLRQASTTSECVAVRTLPTLGGECACWPLPATAGSSHQRDRRLAALRSCVEQATRLSSHGYQRFHSVRESDVEPPLLGRTRPTE
jgi:hypothetical protein